MKTRTRFTSSRYADLPFLIDAQNHKCKIALITGAKKGIGYELARQVGKEGLTVLMAARNAALGDAAAGKLKADGAKAYFIELDVTKPETIARAAKTILVGHIFLAHLLTFLCGERHLPPPHSRVLLLSSRALATGRFRGYQ